MAKNTDFSFNEYLIGWSVEIDPKFRSGMMAASKSIRQFRAKLDKDLRKIRIPAIEGRFGVIRVDTKVRIDDKRFTLLAREFDKLRDSFTSKGNGLSPLGLYSEKQIEVVKAQINKGFAAEDLRKISHQLTEALENSEAVIFEDGTGVDVAFANIIELSDATQPYKVDLNDEGEVTGYSPRDKPGEVYKYSTKEGDVLSDGYWAFHEFGTKRGSDPLHFVLNSARTVHGEDVIALEKISFWMSKRIRSFNDRAKKIMSKG